MHQTSPFLKSTLLSGYLVSKYERGLNLSENLEFQPIQRCQHLAKEDGQHNQDDDVQNFP